MNKLLIAACAFVAVPAFAQAPPPGAGTVGARVQLRADVIARTQRMFAMLDTNHDGVLDQSELAAAGKRWDGAPGAGAAPVRMPMDRNSMFDMIDANHDGMISRDEFARAPTPLGAAGRDRDGGAQIDRGHGMGGGMARMWQLADANHDGRVTLQEAINFALQRFDRLDTNHDGQLTPEERAAGHAKRGE